MGLTPFAIAAPATEEPIELEEILVPATPFSSSQIDNNKIPHSVQTVSAKNLAQGQSLSLAEHLNRYLIGVNINEAQSNPLQPDVYYRGFVASPLMGMPQGLSIYLNGIRFNEPFGDSVNWDLFSQNAIQTMTLQPGSNPIYGLNTLGGALSIRTKNGFDFYKPQHQLEVYGGSWGRHTEDLSSGGHFGSWGYFVNLNYLNEDGWRDFSPTEAKRGLISLSWHGDKLSTDLTVMNSDNTLFGNGPLPIQLYQQNSQTIFTHPDRTINRLFFSELELNYQFNSQIKFSANGYFRQNKMRSFNGDNSDFAPCPYQKFLCVEPGERVIDMQNRYVKAGDAVEGAINNFSETNMRSTGGNLQLQINQAILGYDNHFIIGASYDSANTHYAADTELASLTDTRGTIGSGILTLDDHVRLNTQTETYGFYFTDSFSITKPLTLTIAGRYNHSELKLNNQFISGIDKLSGTHIFDRFNPAIGLTYQFTPWLTHYANYSESTRIPTPMELSCADINDPCKLPNAFLADPPLKQVVAKTWEAGFKGSLIKLLPAKTDSAWNLGFFHTTNHNDIVFRRNGTNISTGYFNNIGSTRRYGIEASLSIDYSHLFSEIDDWHFNTNYTYLNARYLNEFTIQNPQFPEISATVNRGDRIPGLAEHIFKTALSVELWRRYSLGIDGMYQGNQFLRSDESNLNSPLSGYWLFNLKTEAKLTDYLTLFARVNNLFDQRYQTFGVYGDATEVLGDSYTNRRFVSPGAPRAGWLGIRLSL